MGYSAPSRSIHAGIGGPRRENADDEIDRNISHVGLLASHVVVCAYRLAGIDLAGDVRLLADVLSTEEAAQMLQQTHGAQHAIGDIVFAYGEDVCLVLGRSESKYGYSSYRVQYITKPMLDEVPADEFPARYVHKLIPRAELREAMRRALGSDADAVAKVDALEEEELTRRGIATIQEWERSGLLGEMFRVFRKRSEAGPLDLSRRDQAASAAADASSSPIGQCGPVVPPLLSGGVERGFVGEADEGAAGVKAGK
jgi:hypothetical protein